MVRSPPGDLPHSPVAGGACRKGIKGGVTTSSSRFSARPSRPEVARHIENLASEVRQLSKAIHDNPETAFEEHLAADLLTTWLADHGFAVQRPLGALETAFRATGGSGRGAGPRVAFLAEYDALPGIGHGCGHNLIAAGALAAAASAAAAMPLLADQIVVIGTPGEEGGGGKALLLERGGFEGIDAALMFHPADRTIPWRHAKASIHLRVTFRGRAAHAAKNPEDGINALAAMIQFYVALDALRAHLPPSSQVHGVIVHGGDAPNVIPERTVADFLVRGATAGAAVDLLDRVNACAHGAALATGASVELTETAPRYAERRNNLPLATRLAEHLVGQGLSVEEPSPDDPSGSSDVGNVSQRLPTIHPYLAIAPRGTPSHSAAFQQAAGSDEALTATLAMASALANTALDLLEDPAFFERVQMDFRTASTPAQTPRATH
jgi:amidohydrolase